MATQDYRYELEEDDVPDDLAPLDETLRCVMCGDRYKIAVTIGDPNCGHTFCAECILKSFKTQMEGTLRKRTCPQCRCEVKSVETSLVTNRAVQEAVIEFEACLSRRKEEEAKERDVPLVTPSQTKKRPIRGNRKQCFNIAENDADVKATDTLCEKKTEMPSERPQSLHYRPPIDYNRKTPAQLKEMCKKDGISVAGSKEVLANRHASFLILWNAERYSIRPRQPKELADLFTATEKNIERVKMFSLKEQKYSASLKNLCRTGSSGDPIFDATLHGGFKNLINAMATKPTNKGNKNKSELDEGQNIDDKTHLGAGDKIAGNSHECAASAQEDINPAKTVVSIGDVRPHDIAERGESTIARTVTNVDEEQGIAENTFTYLRSDNAIDVDTIQIIDAETAEGNVDACHAFAQEQCMTDDTSIIADKNSKKRMNGSTRTMRQRPKRERRTSLSAWTCNRCTYYNEKHVWANAGCEMCQTKRSER